ncbi:MAG: S-layer homology domain-containing protein [Firmicutes bacterium]|nr:S-layer homology domain-containing protein [Bacillota bacterium]
MKKKFIKVAAAAMCFAMTASSMAFAAELPRDVEDSSIGGFSKAISELMDAGIVTGDETGLFHPAKNLNRAELCIMIVKAIDPKFADLTGTVTIDVPDSGFTDMKGYGWAKAHINYAANNDIAKGYTDGTFKPGNNVTMAELATFAVRACGYTDSDLTGSWPQNYISKAEELGLFNGLGIVDTEGNLMTASAMQKFAAPKDMAAYLIYNALPAIKKANIEKDQPQGTDKDTTSNIPNFGSFTFASGSFNSDINTYNGIALAKDVTVFVYGDKKDYKRDMTFEDNRSAYRETTVYKYKSVSTPAFYKMSGGKITEMVVPADVGFSGKIYCVINSAQSRVLNYAGESVTGIETITAGREITWFAEKALTEFPAKSEYMTGEIYELYARDGEIRSIAKVGDADIKGKVFKEFTNGMTEVADKNDGLIKVDSDWYSVKDNAAVYVLEDNEYSTGSLSSIRKGDKVRLYDISDDDESSVDIVVVNK